VYCNVSSYFSAVDVFVAEADDKLDNASPIMMCSTRQQTLFKIKCK